MDAVFAGRRRNKKTRKLKYKCNKFPICIVATCIDVVGERVVKKNGIATISGIDR